MNLKRLYHKMKLKIYAKLNNGCIRHKDLHYFQITVGNNTRIYSTKLDLNHGNMIFIGDNCIISDCRILTHDASAMLACGRSQIGRVTIGNNCFIGADSIILPGVTIGDNVIVAAGAVCTKDIPSNSVVGGIPARYIESFDSFIKKMSQAYKYYPERFE